MINDLMNKKRTKLIGALLDKLYLSLRASSSMLSDTTIDDDHVVLVICSHVCRTGATQKPRNVYPISVFQYFGLRTYVRTYQQLRCKLKLRK